MKESPPSSAALMIRAALGRERRGLPMWEPPKPKADISTPVPQSPARHSVGVVGNWHCPNFYLDRACASAKCARSVGRVLLAQFFKSGSFPELASFSNFAISFW